MLTFPSFAVLFLDSVDPLLWLRMLVLSLSDMLCIILYLLALLHAGAGTEFWIFSFIPYYPKVTLLKEELYR